MSEIAFNNGCVAQVEVGDCRETMRGWASQGVKAQTCVTSPPYFGLRDYGHVGQIGLKQTPEQYVAAMVEVFRCVRDVLADDGTLWLNIGDSYSSGGRTTQCPPGGDVGHRGMRGEKQTRPIDGMKPKDLIGIPWMLAFALRQPYYMGRIKNVMDRIWLAAMIDAEGCFFIHKRKAGSASGAKFTRADGSEVAYDRVSDTFSPGVEVCNTHPAIVQRCMEIAGVGSISVQEDGRKQALYRWNARGDEARMLAREVYPYLVGKMQQARIVAGCPTNGDKAAAGHEALKGLHHGVATDVDFGIPASPTEPGYYLRQDLIWAKPNPMPESVRDRCTKAHEYVFLFSKQERYYFDSEAMREPASDNPVSAARRNHADFCTVGTKAIQGTGFGQSGQGENSKYKGETRNRRSVWTVATRPYKGAHFATYPPALIEPCILAGSRPGDIVLDPFMGSGTTAAVALQHGRNALGCELNPEYAALLHGRCE